MVKYDRESKSWLPVDHDFYEHEAEERELEDGSQVETEKGSEEGEELMDESGAQGEAPQGGSWVMLELQTDVDRCTPDAV